MAYQHDIVCYAGNSCLVCETQFTLTNRKHHCRQCEKLVCNDCSGSRLDKRKSGGGKADRVCDKCVQSARETLLAQHPRWFPPPGYISAKADDTSVSYCERMWWVYNGDTNLKSDNGESESILIPPRGQPEDRVENPEIVVPRLETALSAPLAVQRAAQGWQHEGFRTRRLLCIGTLISEPQLASLDPGSHRKSRPR